jgi:hypothetical protein
LYLRSDDSAYFFTGKSLPFWFPALRKKLGLSAAEIAKLLASQLQAISAVREMGKRATVKAWRSCRAIATGSPRKIEGHCIP